MSAWILIGIGDPDVAEAHSQPAASEAGGGYSSSHAETGTARPTSAPAGPVGKPVKVIPPPQEKDYPVGTDTSAALDEAKSGRTLRGTPVHKHTAEDFPAESRDIFWQMDKVASGPNGELEPLNFDFDGKNGISKDDIAYGNSRHPGKTELDAIRGRNTWLLWGGGNEAFWGWLQEEGYGFVDFQIMLDGRRRDTRFRRTGFINQPGFEKNRGRRVLGLYLDEPIPGEVLMTVPRFNPKTGKALPAGSPVLPYRTSSSTYEDAAYEPPFERGKDRKAEEMFQEVKAWLEKADDGVNPQVYGYPSGIFGLRLMLNPDFFGNTREAQNAREYWDARVIKPAHANYYSDPAVNADPRLVRPFRVSMSCGFCHVGPHPLLPPADPENPEWENLSSIIGNQYWRPQQAFGNLLGGNSFLHHFLASQAPGTIDTSLVSTDHINNANTINAVFDVPARLKRAASNSTEEQGAANLLMPSIEDDNQSDNPRHFPRVLLDGSDSCGAFAALIRVPLNIGTFSEQWARCHNPVIGFTPQKPFSVASSQANSVYWQTNQKYRVPYMARFFTMKTKERPFYRKGETLPSGYLLPAQNATAPMRLLHARDVLREPETGEPQVDPVATAYLGRKVFKRGNTGLKLLTGKDSLATDREAAEAALKESTGEDKLREEGRTVFLQHCAICHSSKQPTGFALSFRATPEGRDMQWADVPATTKAHYVLPTQEKDWRGFKASPAFQNYVRRITELANEGLQSGNLLSGDVPSPDKADLLEFNLRLIAQLKVADPFLRENFMSSEVRVPVTLVGTNSARAAATNAKRGQMWDNFSSEDYKKLPGVGPVKYFNIVDRADQTYPHQRDGSPGMLEGGPGYYRQPSLLSLWTSGPYLHNNTLGGFAPSFEGEKVWNPGSVSGRYAACEDGLGKMFEKDLRPRHSTVEGVAFERSPGDLTEFSPDEESGTRAKDPGFIYRLPNEAWVSFEPRFIRQLLTGIVGGRLLDFLAIWLWVILFGVWIAAFFLGGSRHVGILFIVLALLVAALGLLTGMAGGAGTTSGALVAAAMNMLEMPPLLLWGIIALLAGIGFLFLFSKARLTSLAVAFLILLGCLLVFHLAMGFGHVTGLIKLLDPNASSGLPGRLWWQVLFALLLLGALLFVIRRNEKRAVKTVFAALATLTVIALIAVNGFLDGDLGRVAVGPLPRGTPVNLLMNMDPDKRSDLAQGLVAMVRANAEIKRKHLKDREAYDEFERIAGAALLKASKCPDFVLDRGHYFGEHLEPEAKRALISFLKTL